MDLLNKLRRPENRILLISNRSNRDLNLEVDQLNLRHYFDGILGDEQISTYGLNEEDRPIDEIKSRLPEKPDSAKLVELMENLNTRNVKRITLWGDRKSDLTQGNTLPEKYKGIERHGVLVNPSINLDKAAAQGMTSAYSLTQLHEHPQLQ